jgi:hypothetical protein
LVDAERFGDTVGSRSVQPFVKKSVCEKVRGDKNSLRAANACCCNNIGYLRLSGRDVPDIHAMSRHFGEHQRSTLDVS